MSIQDEPEVDPHGYVFIKRAIASIADANKCGLDEARLDLRTKLSSGERMAFLMDRRGRLFGVPAYAWNTDDCRKWLISCKASLKVSDWRVSFDPEQEVPISWLYVDRSSAEQQPEGENAMTPDLPAGTAPDEKRAIVEATKILMKDKNITKAALQSQISQLGIKVSNVGFKTRVWVRARENAGLPAEGKAGRRPSKQSETP